MVAYGRLVDHDPLSRNFAHPAPAQLVPKTVLWAHHNPVLDQGQVGSCTGNALAQCLNTDYFAPVLKAVNKGQPLLEADALNLYAVATHLDGISGNNYPPNDGGSSGIGVAKAGKRLGYLKAYRHSFTFSAFLSVLQTQPLIVGIPWYVGMEDPARDGLVRPTGGIAGGHEVCILGADYGTKRVCVLNSWSAAWGVNGRCFVGFDDFASLLANQGDATIPVGVV